MIRYATPSLTFTVNGYDLTSAEVYVTFSQMGVSITKSDADVSVSYADDVSTITVDLTQSDTSSFREGIVTVQVNAMLSDGSRIPTEQGTIEVFDNLLDEVLTYGG